MFLYTMLLYNALMTQPPQAPSQPPPFWNAPHLPLPTPEEVSRTATTLDNMLRWLRGLTIANGVITLVLSLGFVLAMTLVPSVADSQLSDSEWRSMQPLFWVFMLPFIALMVAFYWLTVLLLGWFREYAAQLSGAALGAGVNTRRLSELHQTFVKYIVASQWAMPVLGVVLALFPLVLFAYLPHAGMDTLLLAGLFILLPMALVSVVNWLFCAALRRWLEAATGRMRGLKLPVTPAAVALCNWLIGALVLLGLSALSSLGNLFSPLSVLGALHSGGVVALLALLLAGIVGLMALVGLAGQVVQFLAVLHARTLIEQTAARLDRSPEENLPMNSGNPYGQSYSGASIRLEKS